MTWTVLIADDEPLGRKKLQNFLADVPWARCVAVTTDGPSTLRAIDEQRPDLALLDIRMPGMTAIEVLKRVKHQPKVIFTTAFDRYAVTAFELQAIDYLLKPFGRERFRAAMDRVRDQAPDPSLHCRVEAAFTNEPVGRLFVYDRGRIFPVSVNDITRIEARGDYARVYAAGQTHLVHIPMNQLETRLESSRFLRIHRAHIVNMDFVEAMVPHEGSRLAVKLKDGTTVLASRRRSQTIRGFVV